MGLLHLLVAALAASAAMAADTCACVNPTQTIDTINSPMIFFQQPTLGGVMNGVTCSMNCDFVANLDAGADDDSALQIQLLTSKLGDGSMTVDGMNDTLTITSNTPTGILFPRSVDTSITIHFTEGATNNGEFMMVVQKVKGRPAKPVVKVTTPAPVTAPYDPKFTHNPLLVANDIMLAFDLSSGNIETYKTFARNLIKELTINPKSLESDDTEDCGAGSRLSLVGLSALNGFDNLYAPYWTTSLAQADGNIGSFVKMASGNFFFKPVDEKYVYGFDKPKDYQQETDKPYTTCQNREKLFILFTSVAPAEYVPGQTNGGDETPFTDFLNKGVHQILVHYNMAEADKKYYNHTRYETASDKSNIWNFFELSGSDKDTENFYNSFLVDSKEPMTCQPKSKEQTVVYIGADKVGTGAIPIVAVNIPPYYNAKGIDGKDWDTPRHYCNFQETTIQLKRDESIQGTAAVPVCVKVYYDLETGNDFVSIFSGDPAQPALQKEVVRLTGSDVSGTTFDLPDALGSIVFSSDEKNVFDGFHAEITRGKCQ